MSCRRGVKDGDCGCCKSLAAKVRELYQRCANAIKSINGINPDGANNFDILAGAGIQVNPRANGIEIVATGAAPQDVVKTINTEGPDASGEFTISAGAGIQINAGTNGIEIENISTGTTYTATAPIQIDADNDISLAGWTAHSTSSWSDVVDNGVTTKDILITGYDPGSSGISGTCIYIPKGTTTSSYEAFMIYNWSSDSFVHVYFKLSALTTTGNFISPCKRRTLTTTASGSGINQVVDLQVAVDNNSSMQKSMVKVFVR